MQDPGQRGPQPQQMPLGFLCNMDAEGQQAGRMKTSEVILMDQALAGVLVFS